MYYPYFRGKQYDLITIRENATLLAEHNFVPIVEPVKQGLSGLSKTIDAVKLAGGSLILIVNPSNGEHSDDGSEIIALLTSEYKDHFNIHIGILLSADTSIGTVEALSNPFKGSRKIVFIHNGFSDHQILKEFISNSIADVLHVFIDGMCGKLYQRHFKSAHRVLIRDGFEKRANKAHPDIESFSELHLTYEDEGMIGFGDYLIVGSEFSEAGGPAWAVAIHITFINSDDDDIMYIHHFKSDRNDTPTDPAGKFAEALAKLCSEVNDEKTSVFKTEAISEFLDLKARGHFPGLGYVKKLSMQHHIETIANFASSERY